MKEITNCVVRNALSVNATEDPVVKAAKVNIKRSLRVIKEELGKIDEVINGSSSEIGKAAIGNDAHSFLVEFSNMSNRQAIQGIISKL